MQTKFAVEIKSFKRRFLQSVLAEGACVFEDARQHDPPSHGVLAAQVCVSWLQACVRQRKRERRRCARVCRVSDLPWDHLSVHAGGPSICCVRWSNKAAAANADIKADDLDVPAQHRPFNRAPMAPVLMVLQGLHSEANLK